MACRYHSNVRVDVGKMLDVRENELITAQELGSECQIFPG